MKISKELAKGSTALLVLSVLAKREMYGYQIIRTVEVMSEDVFQLNEGTLYPILHSLENEGYLTSYWSEKSESARRRKYYKITPQGLMELESQKQEWNVYSSAVTKVLGGAEIVIA
jgi:PadR family transcriptional regulator PadR